MNPITQKQTPMSILPINKNSNMQSLFDTPVITYPTIKIVNKSTPNDNYKLTIPMKVENKIRYTCQKIWDVEWSGVLFFKYEGSFEENNLNIICEDFFVMDIGSSGYTEFFMSPDVISYMAENDLLDCQMSLIHSHNNMATFISGTDLETLRVEGIDRNNFVSLIVNNQGNYTAAITRKVKEHNVSKTYDFFDKGEVVSLNNEVKETVIEYFNLKIVKEIDNNVDIKSLSDRIKEVRMNKAAEACKREANRVYGNTVVNSTNSNKQLTLSNEMKKDYQEEYDLDIPIDSKTIENMFKQIITSNLILPDNSKLDVEKWIKNMPNIFNKRFDDINKYRAWIEEFIEFITINEAENNLTKINNGWDAIDIQIAYCEALLREVTKYEKNEYTEAIFDTLNGYIDVSFINN